MAGLHGSFNSKSNKTSELFFRNNSSSSKHQSASEEEGRDWLSLMMRQEDVNIDDFGCMGDDDEDEEGIASLLTQTQKLGREQKSENLTRMRSGETLSRWFAAELEKFKNERQAFNNKTSSLSGHSIPSAGVNLAQTLFPKQSNENKYQSLPVSGNSEKPMILKNQKSQFDGKDQAPNLKVDWNKTPVVFSIKNSETRVKPVPSQSSPGAAHLPPPISHPKVAMAGNQTLQNITSHIQVQNKMLLHPMEKVIQLPNHPTALNAPNLPMPTFPMNTTNVIDIPDGSGAIRYPSPDLNSLIFDPSIGLRFDPKTGLHYDANSGFYYNSHLQKYLMWDSFTQTYLLKKSAADVIIANPPAASSEPPVNVHTPDVSNNLCSTNPPVLKSEDISDDSSLISFSKDDLKVLEQEKWFESLMIQGNISKTLKKTVNVNKNGTNQSVSSDGVLGVSAKVTRRHEVGATVDCPKNRVGITQSGEDGRKKVKNERSRSRSFEKKSRSGHTSSRKRRSSRSPCRKSISLDRKSSSSRGSCSPSRSRGRYSPFGRSFSRSSISSHRRKSISRGSHSPHRKSVSRNRCSPVRRRSTSRGSRSPFRKRGRYSPSKRSISRSSHSHRRKSISRGSRSPHRRSVSRNRCSPVRRKSTSRGSHSPFRKRGRKSISPGGHSLQGSHSFSKRKKNSPLKEQTIFPVKKAQSFSAERAGGSHVESSKIELPSISDALEHLTNFLSSGKRGGIAFDQGSSPLGKNQISPPKEVSKNPLIRDKVSYDKKPVLSDQGRKSPARTDGTSRISTALKVDNSLLPDLRKVLKDNSQLPDLRKVLRDNCQLPDLRKVLKDNSQLPDLRKVLKTNEKTIKTCLPTDLRSLKLDCVLTRSTVYSVWRDKIKSEMVARNCIFTVDKSIEGGHDLIESEKVLLKEIVRSFITSHLDDYFNRLVQHIKDPAEVMSVLDRVGKQSTKQWEYSLTKQLGELKYVPENETVAEFIVRFNELVRKIRECSSLDDSQAKINLVMAIDNAFPKTVALELATPEGLSIKQIEMKMIEEEKGKKRSVNMGNNSRGGTSYQFRSFEKRTNPK